ncbi:MAG: hypothetical protein AB1894_26600 [Chloroflexota bacterium]
MLSDDNRQAALDALEQARPVMVKKLLDEVYAEAFWQVRFGSLGRMHAEQDANYHLDNLIVALRFDLDSSTAQHYQWLRNVLVKRGMCTRHLRRTLDSLQRLIAETLPAEWPAIQPYLLQGYTGLACTHPACQALAAQEQSIARAVTEKMAAGSPQSAAAGADLLQGATRLEEILCHLSYLQDAIEQDAPQMFTAHVEWLAGYLARHTPTPAVLYAELRWLAQEIETRLAPQDAAPFLQLLEQTQVRRFF